MQSFSNEKIEKYAKQYLNNYSTQKKMGNYEEGCVLLGAQMLEKATKDEFYKRFVKDYSEAFVNRDEFNVENIHAGKILFDIYGEKKDEKYKKVLNILNEELKKYLESSNKIELDSLYKMQPFNIRYETEFNGKQGYFEIYNQFMNARDEVYDEEKGLCHHGLDNEDCQLKEMGWYLISLIDTLEYMSEEIFLEYRGLQVIFKEAVKGIIKYKDQEKNMWYEMPSKEGNSLDTEGSLMIAYALMKGARLGFINEKYAAEGKAVFESICNEYLKEGAEGKTSGIFLMTYSEALKI